MLQCYRSLHVGASVVDSFSSQQGLIVDGSCPGVVSGLAGLDQLNEKLRSNVTVTAKETVNIEGGVKANIRRGR